MKKELGTVNFNENLCFQILWGEKVPQCEISDERFTMKHHMERHLKSAYSLVEVKPEETTK